MSDYALNLATLVFEAIEAGASCESDVLAHVRGTYPHASMESVDSILKDYSHDDANNQEC